MDLTPSIKTDLQLNVNLSFLQETDLAFGQEITCCPNTLIDKCAELNHLSCLSDFFLQEMTHGFMY